MEKAYFAAGCFWGVEATYRQVPGVVDVVAGYMGGHMQDPTYEDVRRGKTGHAEVVEVHFDPEQVSYEKLLDTFWNCHNPTTLNRQGPDIGTQYRNAIYCLNARQQHAAEAAKESLNNLGAFRSPIVTEVTQAGTFYPAEEYHQRYLEKRGLAHCKVV
jgi:peptide-methionine (S)-S-oxide reductase